MKLQITILLSAFFCLVQGFYSTPKSFKLKHKQVSDNTKSGSIDSLLNIAIKTDSFIYEDELKLRIKSGNLFSNKIKHAIVIYEKYNEPVIDIYNLESGFKKIVMHIVPIDVSWVSLNTKIVDANFDSVKDLLITRSVSNGISAVNSHLYIYKEEDIFTKVLEVDTMANFSIEKNVVTAHKVGLCYDNHTKATSIQHFTWSNDTLVYQKTVYPCTSYGAY